ncbi:alpha/beta fold hydrolase [Polyangium jinanense]|uniref:Alpha/beta hydrolase n=1 Tax=Polyangium jinanense TaxID=2829994 RepID=A0A9X4ATP5_9BACT|nr:alpha/beta hydrolase [Polyangium jinanense]MDC3960092.1 alpha/beta hydrolase [Polyangium jinanense]MDC3984409.1 alpha/beta hydrolase [Polyangium jinanense]
MIDPFRRAALAGVALVMAACQPAAALSLSQLASAASSRGSSPAKPAAPGQTFDAELSGYAYPFEVKTFPVAYRGRWLAMRYMDVSPARPNGSTVVLLHGKNFVSAYWEPTMRALLDEGYRVVAPDQIGFGKSSKPADYPFIFQELARNTHALLESIGVPRAFVVGHSMGGMLATRYALMFPAATAGLALVNPIGLEDWKTVVPYKPVGQAFADEFEQTPEKIREYMRTSYFAGAWEPSYDKLLEPIAGFTRAPDYRTVAWCSAATFEMIFTQPVVYEFPRIRVPTLLIIGQRDRTALGKAWAPKELASSLGNYPELGRAAQRAIPGSKLVEIEEAGHLPQVETFDIYRSALVAFLKSVPPSP